MQTPSHRHVNFVRVLAAWASSAALCLPVFVGGLMTPLGVGVGLGSYSESSRAGLFEDDDARRSILDLRTRVDGLTRDMARRLEDLAARLERLEAASGGQLTLANRIEELRREIERLRGELELQSNELAATQRRLRDQYAEVDSRVKRFEPIQVTVDGQSFSVDPMERRGYDGALALFRAGEFRNALVGFDALIAQFPQTPYGIQAMYWSGVAQYALKDWRSAAETLQSLIRRHPNHARVPEAYLRLGGALLELGDYRLARRTWESLIDRFPTSPQAAEARERLPTAVEPVVVPPPPTVPPPSSQPPSSQPSTSPSGAAADLPGSQSVGSTTPLPPSAGGPPSNAQGNRVLPPQPAAQLPTPSPTASPAQLPTPLPIPAPAPVQTPANRKR